VKKKQAAESVVDLFVVVAVVIAEFVWRSNEYEYYAAKVLVAVVVVVVVVVEKAVGIHSEAAHYRQ
jgi:hypothetical protein